MSKTIYAVNSGSYDDYRIDALFSSKKLAEYFMAAVKDDDYNNIKEFELDPPAADLIRRGYLIWQVHMLRDGTTELVRHVENDLYQVEQAGQFSIWQRTKAPATKDKGIPDILTGNVWAKTETQAVKIMNEKRTQMIASGEWK